MSSWRNRALSRSLKPRKKSRLSLVSATSTKTHTNSSRYSSPWCCHRPRMTCVSAETAPNRCRISRSVSPTSVSGTDWPSLNRRGSRISNRRSELLLRSWSHDRERDSLQREGGQCGGRDESFAVGPTLERKSPSQE